MGCQTNEKVNDPIYFVIGQMNILYMLVDDCGQGDLFESFEVGVWGTILDGIDESDCVPEGIFNIF